MLEEALNSLDAGSVDLGSYLSRLVSCHQMASSCVTRVHTRFDPTGTTLRTAKVLGVALTEILHFVDRGAAAGDGVQLSVTLKRKDGFLVVALMVFGDYHLVAPIEAMAALARATRLAEAMGGLLRRGEEGGRMFIHLIIPWQPPRKSRLAPSQSV